MLATTKFQSSFSIRFQGNAVEAGGVELYVWAIYDPEEDHSGHDHGRVLQETVHSKATVKAFNIKSAKTGEALKAEVVYVDGEPFNDATEVREAKRRCEFHGDPLRSSLIHSSLQPEDGAESLAFLSCFLVLLVTLIGVVFTVPVVEKMMAKSPDAKTAVATSDVEAAKKDSSHGEDELEALTGVLSHEALAYSQAFSAGAILSTAFLLVLPEATGMIWNHLVRESTELEATAWSWGTCILAGKKARS